MRHVMQWCALSLLVLVPNLVLAQQHLIVAEESTSAAAFRSQIGRVLTFICPANTRTNREIWGTDVYHVDSPVCTAAAHAGVFTPGTSSQVTIVMGPGAASFDGRGRNGVKSSSYGPSDATYSFKSGEVGHIDWITTLERIPDDFHAPITVVCPPKGQADAYVWGTDVYTSSSAICVAAVHARAITLDAGGRVAITLVPKQETFIASERYGIWSRKWTNWDFMSYGQPYKVTPGMLTVTAPTSTPAREAGPREAVAGMPATTTGTATPSTTPARTDGAVVSGPRAGTELPPSATAPKPSTPLERNTRPTSPAILDRGPAPEGLTVSGTPGLANVKWNAVVGATGYRVLRAPAGTAIGGSAWTPLTANPINATTATDELPDPLAGYAYQVIAYQANGSFGAATVEYLPPPPADPTDFTATIFPPAEVRLSWKAVANATEYRLSGPGFAADAKTAATSIALPNAPSGLNVYRVAAVYPPGKVLTPAAQWPSATLPVPPIPKVRQLTLPNGEGSLAEYNTHACAAGKWIASKVALPNPWCFPAGNPPLAPITLLPILNAFVIDQWVNWDSKLEPVTEFTALEDQWVQYGRRLDLTGFFDAAHLNRHRSVACAARGAPINATLCWAHTGGGHLTAGERQERKLAGILDSYQSMSAGKWSAILQTADGSYFLSFQTSGPNTENRLGGKTNTSVGATDVDYQGLRNLPHACLSCHGGIYDAATGAVVGASLLPLDPRDLLGASQEPIRLINAQIYGANTAPAVRKYIDDMYRGQVLVPGATAHDDVPSGWSEQPGLYRQIYRPYCASCHLTQQGPLGFRSWGDLYRERGRVKRSVCEGTMPHAEVPFWRFWTAGGSTSLSGVLLAALGFEGC